MVGDEKMRKYTIKSRMEIARRAVMEVRGLSRHKYRHSLIFVTPKEWAIGVIGLLDYVEKGDTSKIMLGELRDGVERILREEYEKTQITNSSTKTK